MLKCDICTFLVGEDKNEKATKNGKSRPTQQTKKKMVEPVPKKKLVPYVHPWLCRSYNNHTYPVLAMDLSPNGKYMVTSSAGVYYVPLF